VPTRKSAKGLIMLEAYRAHVAERAEQGVLLLLLSAD
jgi:hypothetical protein